MNGRLIGSPSGADVESPYLLSGIARCAECGGSLVAMTRSHGKRRVAFYGCLRFHKRGRRACRNGLQIRQAVLDRVVLDELTKRLDAEAIAEAVRAAVAELTGLPISARLSDGTFLRRGRSCDHSSKGSWCALRSMTGPNTATASTRRGRIAV